MLSTTINIKKEIFIKITKTAIFLKKSRCEIITLLLMRVMRDHQKIMNEFVTVKYQPDADKKKWHCFHIRFKHDEYEFFIDLRKVCKCSVSLLVAIAVDRYIDELIKNFQKGVDNNTLFSNYIFRRIIVEGIYCWHFYWGYPTEHIKTLRLQKTHQLE